MKTKLFNQIFFSLLILALGGWAFYEYKQSQKEQAQKEEEASLLNKKLEDLKTFRIKKEGHVLETTKENQDWFLKQPVKDLADFTEISRWFDEIKNQKIQNITKKEGIKWEDYYLDEAPSVEMEFFSGEIISFSVSKKSSFDGKYFIKKGENLFIGEQYFSSEVNEKDFDSFRNKKLLPSLGHATKIQLKGKESFTLHWSDYKWSFDKSKKKKTFPLDSDRLDGFWTDASSMKASAIKEAVNSSSSLKKYGLNKPQLEIHFNYSDKDKSYSLKLSPFKKEEDKAFVSVSHRDFILEISKEDAKKLILSQKEIRDHAFPFNYKKDLAAQIERKNDKKSFSIKKIKDNWTSLNTKELSIDIKKVKALLEKIKELRGEKYKTDPIKQGRRSLEIKNAAGEIIFELKEGSTSGSHFWVKTNLWDELVAVSKVSLNEIFNHKITVDPKTKEEKKSETKEKN